MSVETPIHGLWVGRTLSKLEQLTLRSFVKHGHTFNLWAYDELDEPLPPGVVLRDASQVLPRDRIFLKAETDPSAGVGRKSYGPFSDLFRYKLLHDHGGIWVDMDLTCLRPFDFEEPYVFRAHPIGLMGNLIKAPPSSELMRLAFEHADKIADEDIPWLTLNKILYQYAQMLQLTPYIRKNIINEGSLADTIVGFAGETYRAPPPSWYGIHWGNEFWGAQTANHSAPTADFATKNRPFPGSLLHEMYRAHGLIDPRGPSEPVVAKAKPVAAPRQQDNAAARPSSQPGSSPSVRRSFHMLVPTLAKGGAERIVLDIAAQLTEDAEIDVYVYVRSKTATSHDVNARSNLFVIYLDDPGAPKLADIANALVARGNPVMFTHLIRRPHLEMLWRAGIATIPVIHNSVQGWDEPPSVYDHANVPFVIACADSVKAELEQHGCPAPVLTVRHEIAYRPRPADLMSSRRAFRGKWGIGDDTLLIGMVGQFKSQKAYTRAVRVLARLREIVPAKLMIVGGWDHRYGAGRTTFEATMRLAVELGVSADLILVGETSNPIPYLASLDVFLNTSIYEGLSVSIMEAIACGCPMVVAAVGGVAEIATPETVLVRDSADIDGYVAGILQVVTQYVRTVPARNHEPDLVARTWLELNKVAAALCRPAFPEATGALFVIDGLHMGGPAVSLARTLSAMQRYGRAGVAVLNGVSADALAETIQGAGAAIYPIPPAAHVSRMAGVLLDILAKNNYRTLCFWSAPPELKLMLGKLLEASKIKIVDVSPGPMLFDEIDAATGFQRRIAFTADQYLARLDRFVALHKSGVPAAARRQPARIDVIPLGVPVPPRFIPLPPANMMLPPHLNPGLAIGTVTRLVPYKRIEMLIDAMAIVTRDIPGASLTIVGAPDASTMDYANELQRKAQALGLNNVFFVGPYLDVNRFLSQWKAFVLVGERQGCPNASLEAMTMGLPVVAYDSGGLGEQIVQGKTGYLVRTPEDLAKRLKSILKDPALGRRLGNEARKRARTLFSLDASAKAFASALDI